MTVFLVGMVSFAVDTGYVAMTRTQMQRAADAGALAGATSLANWETRPIPESDARSELQKYVQLNESLEIRDEDVRLFRFDPTASGDKRLTTTYSVAKPPNAIEVTLRRDKLANGQLSLFFAPMLGQKASDVRVKAVGCIMPAKAVLPGVPMIPYTMHINYYYAALGYERNGMDGQKIETQDEWSVSPNGTVTRGRDGINEVSLFGSDQQTPGNFGAIDLGSKSNGTPELERQILYGPNYSDFHHKDFESKLQPDGSLLPPINIGGDPGISAGVKNAYETIVGKPRIIPLFDSASGTGNNTVYHLVSFAAIVVTDSEFQGNPKRVWIQPTRIITNKVLSADLDTELSEGIWTPPRLVIP